MTLTQAQSIIVEAHYMCNGCDQSHCDGCLCAPVTAALLAANTKKDGE